MQKTLILSMMALSAIVIQAQTIANVYELNTANTVVKWVGKKLAGKHEGTVNVQSGQLTLSKTGVSGGTVTIDMNSITCTDIKDEGTNQSLVGHLKNEDFFDVAKHPTATLNIKSIKPAKKGGQIVSGDLTIKGVTNPVTFPAAIKLSNGKVLAKGRITFDRTKYDIKYGSTLFGAAADKAIDNNVSLDFEVK